MDEAEARVANARSAHPVHAGLAIEYAEIATARRDWPNAPARWRAVLDLLAEAAPPDAHASLGQAYDKQQDYAAADAVLDTARRKFPDDLGIAVAYGRTATNRKDWPEAAARWQSLVKAFGSSAPAEACNGLSRAYRRQGKFAAAETAISESRLLHPADINIAECAELAMARLDWPEAVRRWQTVMDDFPGRITADMYLRISLAHRLHGDFAAARHCLEMLRSTEQSIVLGGYGPISHVIDGRAQPLDVGQLADRICVQLHLYHVNTCRMYLSRLNFIRRPFALFVSIPEHESPKAWHDQLSAELPLATEILVRPVKNRGRDGMPWLCAFRDEILRQGEPARLGQQPRNLREAVFGHHQRCARGAVPGLSGEFVLLGAHAVSAAVVALNLTDADFPEEMSQSDGTLAHAVERIIGLLDKPTGMVKQCVTVTPPLTLDDLAGMGNG